LGYPFHSIINIAKDVFFEEDLEEGEEPTSRPWLKKCEVTFIKAESAHNSALLKHTHEKFLNA
jgi:hypothetical protein